ncbi:MAG: DUF5067 domain-containing protein [Clostridia bacterium]|nr:DUF5067 domain-containing protein [Clostridia bacterium]
MKKIRNLLCVLMCGTIYFMLAVGSTLDSGNVSTSTDSNGTVSEVSEIPKYGINDDIYITNDYGKYRVKITNISETEERNSFSDTKADRVIVIEYEYENLTDEDDLYVSSLNFNAYDKENNKLEAYPANTKYGGTVSKGRKTSASVAYALNNRSNYIEMEYYDNMFYGKPNCKIILEW